jgi:Tfp pilus assembly protein PilO
MSMTRRWSLLTAVLIIGILAASWFLLVSPKRSDAAKLTTKATAQQQKNVQLVDDLNQLKSQSLDLPKQKAQLAVLGKQIPNNPALPTLVRSLTAAGKQVGVQVVSMKPGPPAAVAVPVPVAPPAAKTSGTGTSGTGGTTSAAGTTPTVAAPAAATLYQVPLSLEISGSYFEVEQFIHQLEGMQRTFLLTGFTLKPLGGGAEAGASTTTSTTTTDELSLSLTGQVFLSPNVATSTSAAAPVAAQAQ